MKILITGTTGFIGSATKQELLKRNHQVLPFVGDIRKIADWKKNLQQSPEVILHLAGVKTETDLDFQVNTKSCKNLIQALKDLSQTPQKIIFASSQAVYIGTKPPFKEDANCRPQTVYGKSKYEAEKALCDAQNLDIRVIILRYSTILGRGIRQNSTMSGPLLRWTKNARSNEDISVFQDGKQTRDYIHVSDVVSANILAVEKDIKGTFNVGCSSQVAALSLAELIKKETNSKSHIVITNQFSSSDPSHLFSDTSRLRSLGWNCTKTVKDAVDDFIK